MRVYIFGNEDVAEDSLACYAAEAAASVLPGVEFIRVKPNEDVPFADMEDVVIMDVVSGIGRVEVIENRDLKKLILSPRAVVHDFDVTFQLKYLQKLGKLKNVKIIGLPRTGAVDYRRVQSILRKLVAQDMQGS